MCGSEKNTDFLTEHRKEKSITPRPVACATGFFLFLFRVFVLLAEERFHRHTENLGNQENLSVRGTAHLPLQLGIAGGIDITALYL